MWLLLLNIFWCMYIAAAAESFTDFSGNLSLVSCRQQLMHNQSAKFPVLMARLTCRDERSGTSDMPVLFCSIDVDSRHIYITRYAPAGLQSNCLLFTWMDERRRLHLYGTMLSSSVLYCCHC
eukprot:scaffold37482_cov206-Amphora_coffeaeformis.AAC.2